MHVLVVYGSTRGGTAGLAAMVAVELGAHGIHAEVAAAAAIDDLEGYAAVVVGGALYNNRWHPEASDFVDRFRGELQTMSVWFFSSGPLDDSAHGGDLAPIPQVRELAREIDIRGHMTFGGVLEKKPTGLFGSLLAYGPVGDFRDTRQVHGWVERMVVGLAESRTTIDLSSAYPAAGHTGSGTDNGSGGDGALSRVRRMLTVNDDIDDDAGLDVLL